MPLLSILESNQSTETLFDIVITIIESVMDYSSEDSDISANQNDLRQLQKFSNILKNIKQAKDSIHKQSYERESSKKSVSSVKNAIRQQQQKTLQTKMAFTEKQYAKARENNVLLLKKLSEAQQKNQYLTFELQRLDRERKEEISQLEAQLLKLRKDEQNRKDKFDLQNKERQAAELNDFKKRLEHKQKELERANLKIRSLELDRKNQDNELKNLTALNEGYKKKLSDAQNTMNEVYLGQQSKGAQLLELDEANQTIERLVLLLKNTEEYRKFGNFANDFKEIHYLKNISKRVKGNELSYQNLERKRLCSCTQVKIDERIVWTPASCYKILLELKLKYEEMNEDCIEEILFQLNKIWLAREEAHVSRVKQTYQSQIAKLKKKSEQRYDEMVARKQIQRLKKQLHDTKFSKKSGSSSGENIEMLKSIGQYEDELRLKQKEIKLLQERIKLMQTENNNYDKVLYLEGALWIIDKILEEIERNNEDILEFQNRLREQSHTLTTNEAWINAFKDFFENMEEIGNSLIQKLMIMKESTLRKMGNQRGQLRESSVHQNLKRY